MSIYQIVKVWEHEFSHSHQAVMAALADCANDEGGNIYPGVLRISWKTGYSIRQVKRILKQLREEEKVLVVVKPSNQHETTKYKFDWTKAKKKISFDQFKKDFLASQGDKMSPLPEVTDGTSSKKSGVTNGASGVTNGASGVTPVSPDPSLDPSLDPSRRKEENSLSEENNSSPHPTPESSEQPSQELDVPENKTNPPAPLPLAPERIESIEGIENNRTAAFEDSMNRATAIAKGAKELFPLPWIVGRNQRKAFEYCPGFTEYVRKYLNGTASYKDKPEGALTNDATRFIRRGEKDPTHLEDLYDHWNAYQASLTPQSTCPSTLESKFYRYKALVERAGAVVSDVQFVNGKVVRFKELGRPTSKTIEGLDEGIDYYENYFARQEPKS